MDIPIPYKFTPREYQKPLINAMATGIKRAVCVWHRRAGKDKTAINYVVKEMLKRVGIYYYFLPTYQQGKKVIWDGIDGSGFKTMDHFPKEIIKKKNEAEMKIELKNGSIFQMVGTDNYDAIRGTNPVGTVFSEYSFQDPMVWDLIRPILRENGGFAIFVYTPYGENHGFDLYSMASTNKNWFCEKLTIEDTGVVSQEDIEVERAEGMSEEMIQQEYYCSFGGMMQGAYYANQYQEALESGRITNVPYQKDIPVETWWDLGVSDATSIWFSQGVGREFHIIDYLEESGEGLPYYIEQLQKKGYVYGQHNAPHDIKVRDFGSGLSRIEVARKLGVNFALVPKVSIQDGINAARVIFNQCYFDSGKCADGLRALRNYHKSYDNKRKVFSNHPDHDWSSNGADAFRYMALGIKQAHPTRVNISKEDKEFYRMIKRKKQRARKKRGYNLKMS